MGSKTPNRRRRWLVVSGIGVMVLAAAGFGLYQFVLKPDASATTITRTVTASTQTVQATVGTTGTLEPKRQADLSFSSSGTVTKVNVSVGDKVEKGDVLARIDDTSLEADVTAAKADLAAAESSLSDLEDDANATDTSIASAKAQVTLKKSTLSQATSALSAAALRSTITGTVAEVSIAKGDQVGSGSGSGTGSGSGSSGSSGSSSYGSSSSSSAEITVISTNTYVVDTSVGSSDLSKVKVGLQAVITPAGATDPIYGTVATVGVMASSSSSSAGTSGTSTASFPVTIDVTEAQKSLFAGASATVSIIVEQRDNVLVVPTAAISTVDGKTVVQKVVNGSTAQTEVTIGSTYGNQTEITKGLADGDEVQISFARQAGTATRSGSGNGAQNGNGGRGGFGGGTGQGGFGGGTGQGGFGGGTGQGGFGGGTGGTGPGGNR
jgi:multidrug efflux pump subunit AcrA (membrane-fusion protein)